MDAPPLFHTEETVLNMPVSDRKLPIGRHRGWG